MIRKLLIVIGSGKFSDIKVGNPVTLDFNMEAKW